MSAIDFDDYHRNIRIDGERDGSVADPWCVEDAYKHLKFEPGTPVLRHHCATAAAAYVASEWTLEILTESGVIDRAECIPEIAFINYCAGFADALARRMYDGLEDGGWLVG